MLWKELSNRIKACSYKELSEYLWIGVNTIYSWVSEDSIPRRHKRKIVEFFEMVHDDNMEFCDKLLQKAKK